MSMMDIGSRIKFLRTAKEMTQVELAKMLNVKQNTLSRYENNLKRPSYEVLVKLADIFDVTTDYLLGREEY